MTREEWFCLLQDLLAARINDAPDADCLALAEAMLQEATDTINDLPARDIDIADEDEP